MNLSCVEGVFELNWYLHQHITPLWKWSQPIQTQCHYSAPTRNTSAMEGDLVSGVARLIKWRIKQLQMILVIAASGYKHHQGIGDKTVSPMLVFL